MSCQIVQHHWGLYVCGPRPRVFTRLARAHTHCTHTHTGLSQSHNCRPHSYMHSSPEPSMAVKSATQGPGSCKKKADIGAQLTSLMEVGSTLYCGAGPSFTSTCSFFFLACRLLRLVGLLPRTPGQPRQLAGFLLLFLIYINVYEKQQQDKAGLSGACGVWDRC